MARAASDRALRWAGWGLLWIAAAAGVAISAAVLLAALPATRPIVAGALVRWVSASVAGEIELEGIAVLPHAGVELRGLRVRDPEGGVVLRVERARIHADALGLASREVGLSVELDGVDADAARRSEDGTLAIARAFAPAPAAKRGRLDGAAPPAAGGTLERPPTAWAVRLDRLSLTRGRIRVAAGGAEPLDAGAIALEARGRWGARDAWVEARARAALTAPAAAPLALELRAARAGDEVQLQRLAVALGSDRLEAVGEGSLSRWTGRLAVTRFGVSARDAGALAPAGRLGAELSGTLYVESDGAVATGALEVSPGTAKGSGRAKVAVAARLRPAQRALGLVADVEGLDPSRVTLLAPPGRVTLRANGAVRGTRLADLAGRLGLRIERSRLRGGELGPIELQASAGGGNVEVTRLQGAAPGGSAGGRLRWREGSAVSGELGVVASDLALLGRNVGELLGLRIPELQGNGHAEVTLSGTSKVPRLAAKVDAARLGVGGVRADGARLSVDLQGPAAALSGRVQGGLQRALVGGLELRGVDLDVALGEEEGSLAFTANVPRLGTELVRAMLRGRFGPGRAWFDLSDAAVAWPETRYELAQPARIGLASPAVDRLVLASGAQRIELAGGLSLDGRLDGQLRLANVDLSRLPRGLVPERASLAGLLTLDARASGTRAAPRVDATLGLTGASAYDVGGLQVLGEVAWDGQAERVEADLGLVRERGGAIDLSLDLPLALGRARRSEEARVELSGRSVPLDELVWLAGSYALVSGDVDVTATLTGTLGSPSLEAKVAVRNGTWDDLEGLGLDATVDAKGERARLRATGALAGAGAGTLEADAALELSTLLARPREALEAARRGPFSLALRLPPAGLAPLPGRLGLPPDLAGRVDAEAGIAGSPGSPRGTLRVSLEDGAGWGARAVGARLDAALAPERTGATLDLRLAGKPAARLDATIGAAVERFLDRAALAAAPLRAAVALPRSDLAAWGGGLLALRGTVEGHASLGGTPAAPVGEVSLRAADASVEGRPLGAVAIDGRYGANRSAATLELRPPAGGTLRADASLDHALGLGAGGGPLARAPAALRVSADALDLGFLPALAPGVVRAAAGAATLDLAAAGELGTLRPRGTFKVSKGRIGIAELGDWTDAGIEVDFGADTIELKRFDVRKGKGTLAVRGAIRALSGEAPAEVEATIRSDDFGVERAGMEFARFDLQAEARGQLTREGLTIGVVAPQAEVKLPKRIPRTLQEVRRRDDITVGRPRPARRPAHAAPPTAGEEAQAARARFRTVVHFVAPRRLRVRADQPRIDVELKADAILAFAGSREEATGSIEAIRGKIEPLGGRVFELERGKVTFGGGRIAAGALDVSARYDAPAAKVHALVEGTLGRPQLRLTSEPPFEEAQIAMLIATGRTDVKPGASGVNTLAAGDAGLAAAGALVTGAFKDLLSDKLPVDSVSLDSTAVSAGKYFTDRIYVGYVRRFDAKPEKGENPDEVRFEYQLAPGWQVETRYGSGQSGGASVVWTKNY